MAKSKWERLEEAGQQSLMNISGYRLEYTGGIGTIANSMLPDNDWQMPTHFPDLTREKLISIDIESFDPDLKKSGPGFIRKRAHVVGVALATPSGFNKYYPIAHKEGPNLPRNVVMPWLAEQLASDVPKIGANLYYDLQGLLHSEGVKVQGPILDIQNAEALLDEESALFDFNKFCTDYPEEENHTTAYHNLRGFSLDALAWKYLGRRKYETLLKQVQSILGMKDVKGNLHKLPARIVGAYAEADARLPLDIFSEQIKLLDKHNLNQVWKLECDLTPMLLAMHVRGVRVDIDAAERLNKELRREQTEALDNLRVLAGSAVDPWSNPDLAKLCDRLNLPYPRTAKDNPSFTADWLKHQVHPALRQVAHVRRIEKMRRDFVEGLILEKNVNGRLHPQFHQLRSDEDGTRSGRLSSSNPNGQQIPARDERFGPMIRGLFIPEEGCRWICADYSAQEPRLTVHYASICNLPGAEEAVRRYHADPNTDYHQMVADMAEIARKEAKAINLGLAYGMGRRKLAWKMGYITEAQMNDRNYPLPPEVDILLAKYHNSVPFIKGLMEMTTHAAATRGFIRTLIGRIRHFDLYEPRRQRNGDFGQEQGTGYPLSLARFLYGADIPLVRAFTHKALNALIQGSAADMVKKAMLDLFKLGYVPHLSVHDEIDDSVENEKQFAEIRQVMIEAVKLVVPVRVDAKMAINWGEAK